METEITELVIPNSVTRIRNYAFYQCSGLTSITLPDNITFIDHRAAFPNSTKIYVNRGSNTLLCVWDSDPYTSSVIDISSGKELVPPSLSLVEATQTTVTLQINNKYGSSQEWRDTGIV